jgi:hypothetical protein
MKYVAALVLIFTASCGSLNEEKPIYDQCLRTQLFNECLERLPPGPQTVEYNDWSEVVDSCANTAATRSVRLKHLVKPECRGER